MAAILKNCHISAKVRPIARNLAGWSTLTLLTVSAVKISNLKSKMADGRHIEKSTNRHISAMFDRSTRTFVRWRTLSLWTLGRYNFEFLKIQDGGRPPYEDRHGNAHWPLPLWHLNFKFKKSKMAHSAILITNNRHISATVWPISMKYGRHIDAYCPNELYYVAITPNLVILLIYLIKLQKL